MAFKQLDVEKWANTVVTYKEQVEGQKQKEEKRRRGKIIPGSERRTGPRGRLVRKDNDGRFLHWNSEQGVWHIFPDLFTLYRKFVHIILGYQHREMPTLEQLEKLARECNVRLNASYINRQPTAKRVRRDLHDMLAPIVNARNEFKVQAREKIVASLPMEENGRVIFLDSLGRRNIAPFCAKSVAIRNRFLKRLGEVYQMDPWILQAQSLIHGLMRPSNFLLRAAEQEVNKAIDIIIQAERIRPSHWRNARTQVSLALHDLKQLTLRPYSTLRHYAAGESRGAKKGELQRALIHAEDEETAGFLSCLNTVRESLELKHARIWLERILIELTTLDYTPREPTKRQIREIREAVISADAALDEVTEAGFANPVRAEVQEYLHKVRLFLRPQSLNLVQAKSHLKKAAEKL